MTLEINNSHRLCRLSDSVFVWFFFWLKYVFKFRWDRRSGLLWAKFYKALATSQPANQVGVCAPFWSPPVQPKGRWMEPFGEGRSGENLGLRPVPNEGKFGFNAEIKLSFLGSKRLSAVRIGWWLYTIVPFPTSAGVTTDQRNIVLSSKEMHDAISVNILVQVFNVRYKLFLSYGTNPTWSRLNTVSPYFFDPIVFSMSLFYSAYT